MDLLYPRVGVSVVQILERLGHKIDFPEELACCGQPAFNSGYWDEARAIVRPVLRRLKNSEVIGIVFPAMHLTRGEIKELFARELGGNSSDDPEELTMVARRVLRQKYFTAEIGFTGANFAIAETGMTSITENEGNARLTAALPKTMITLLGIKKNLPQLEDLALFLPLLATSGTGQMLTCYNTMYGGPQQPGESDGPEEFHIVLLDNRRTKLLADAEQFNAALVAPYSSAE